MSQPDLSFAVIARQMGFISNDQFASISDQLQAKPDQRAEELLRRLGWITEDQVTAVRSSVNSAEITAAASLIPGADSMANTNERTRAES